MKGLVYFCLFESMFFIMAEKDYDSKMHTAEHILNSVMNSMFGCGRSFRSHIEKKKSKCDYHFDRMLTGSEKEAVEISVNKIISEDLVLTQEFITRKEAESKYFTGKLPADAGEKIRIVKIGNYDACPCIGPHVMTTGEVGGFYISSVDYTNKILRIRFKLE
jgi:misacylated tRNA(Ala) deacylase